MTNQVLNFIINFGINNLKQKEKKQMFNSLFVTIYCFLFLENQIFQNMHGNNNNIFAKDIKIIMIVLVKLMIIMMMLKKVMVVKELDKKCWLWYLTQLKSCFFKKYIFLI